MFCLDYATLVSVCLRSYVLMKLKTICKFNQNVRLYLETLEGKTKIEMV